MTITFYLFDWLWCKIILWNKSCKRKDISCTISSTIYWLSKFLSGQSTYLSSLLRWKISVLSSGSSSISSLLWYILYLFRRILLFKNRVFENVFHNQSSGIAKYTASWTEHRALSFGCINPGSCLYSLKIWFFFPLIAAFTACFIASVLSSALQK